MTAVPYRTAVPPVVCSRCGRSTVLFVQDIDYKVVCIDCWLKEVEKDEVHNVR